MDLNKLTDDELIEIVKESLPRSDMPSMYDAPSPYGAGWNINRPGDEERITQLIIKDCPPSEIILGYVSGEDANGDQFPAGVIEKIRAHLAKCAECAEEVVLLRSRDK